ncbi:MAG: hypothetical protein JXA46_10130, partial [Dehalococcoidales bacterium]|nr:hypothetical protein [Dehalococcoidales bacterium]
MRKLLICTFLAVFILIILPVSLAAQDAANPMVTADHPGGNGADNGSSDHFRLVRRGTEVLVYIDGDFSQSLTWDLLYTLTIEGSGDDDTLTVDFSGGTPIPPGGLTFNGRGDDSGVDTLEIAGNSESTGSYHPVSRSDGTIIIQESVIHFTGLEPVLISSVASLTFDMGAETSDINITYETGPSTDHGLITATSSESLEFWDVNNLEIISGSGSDIIDIINPFVPLNLQTFTVDGGPGDDTFNVTDTGNGLPGPVSLNGGEDNDTFNVSPSTSAVINIDGENGNDTLIVDPHGEKAWFSGSEVLFYGESGFKEITCTNIETVTFLNAGSISGTKFNDLNGNGVKNARDTGLELWQIFIDIDLNGVCDAGEPDTSTDTDGNYTFTLSSGTYRVREVVQSGWSQSTVDPPDVTLNNNQSVSGINFGNYQPATKRGRCFDDLNGNGSRDDEEPGLKGWTINLDGTDGLGQTVSLTTTTNDDGLYSFEVPPGKYTISQVLQTGWVQTFPDIPGDGDWDV